jgi:dolichol-phosphate mannosyltransferase
MEYSDFTVILPTLNEEGNIGRILKAITSEYRGINVIVSDDGSQDRTMEIVRSFQDKNKNVAFLDRRQKADKGLTASVVDAALHSRSRYLIVMDADMQHPPEKIREMVKALIGGCRLVVAVRESAEGWEIHRKLVSKILIAIGYAMLVVRGSARCGDIFSGYFGIDRRLFASLLRSSRKRFIGSGYKVLYDVLKCVGAGELPVREVPYAFNLRGSGKSKAGARHVAALLRSFIS